MKNKEEKVSTGNALLKAKAAYDELNKVAVENPLGVPEEPVVAAEKPDETPMNHKELLSKLESEKTE